MRWLLLLVLALGGCDNRRPPPTTDSPAPRAVDAGAAADAPRAVDGGVTAAEVVATPDASTLFRGGLDGSADGGATPVRHAAARIHAAPFRTAAPIDSAEALRAWQPRGRERILEVLQGGRAPAAEPPLALRVRREARRGQVRRIELDYQLEEGLRVPATLFLRADLEAPAPGVLLWHGHHDDGRRSAAVVSPRGRGEFAGALELAAAGFVVLTPDIRGIGETGNRREHIHLTMLQQFDGRPMFGVLLRDAGRALDVLAHTRSVDSDRLAVAGLSLGGQLALYLAAVDDRVRVAVVQGYLGSHHAMHLSGLYCPCNYVAGLASEMDISDVALLAAPRPLLFVAGRSDPEFPIEPARQVFDRVERGFDVLGAAESASLVEHDGGHLWVGEAATAFLRAHLVEAREP